MPHVLQLTLKILLFNFFFLRVGVVTNALETETELLGLTDQPAQLTYKLQISKRPCLKEERWRVARWLSR